jgi:hypothetical protein
MRRVVVGCVVAWAGVALNGECAGGEADDLLLRARKVQTGSADSAQVDARLIFRGTLFVDGQRVRLNGEFVARSEDRDRLTLTVTFDEAVLQLTILTTRSTVQHFSGGKVPGLSNNHYLESLNVSNLIREAAQAALLHGSPDSQLLFTEKISGRAASGFRFRPPREEPSWRYYLDNETAALLKVAARNDGTKRPAVECLYSGHAESVAGTADVQALKALGLDKNPEALAWFLRNQTRDTPPEKTIRALIAKLGHDEFAVREKASKDVADLGRPALPLLDRATKSVDAEVARRAEEAAELIRARLTSATVSTAVRELARQNSADAAGVLLDRLAGADPEVAGEIRAALAALARRDGMVDPALEKALNGTDEGKRRAAEAALGKDGGEYLKQPGRRLYPGPCTFPAKVVISVSGKPVAEVEFVDVQFFNRLDDRAFAKP